MAVVVYDSCEHVVEYDPNQDILTEQMNGYKIIEHNDNYFVIYNGFEGERRFSLPNDDVDGFVQLKRTLEFSGAQQFLTDKVEDVKRALAVSKDFETACENVYKQSYFGFVALNLTKLQFCNFVKQRLKG